MKPTRNAPCPCGSGKKYKRCCGAGTQIEKGTGSDQFPLAVEAYQSGQSAQAMQICESILSESPRYADALHLSGLILFENRNYKEAINRLSEATKRMPRDAQVFYSLALAEQAAGDFGHAHEHSEKATALNPDFQEARMLSASLLVQQDHIEQAIKVYNSILQKHPENNEAAFYLANLELHNGNVEKAIDLYEPLLDKASGNASLHYNLALAYQQLERLSDAMAQIRLALDAEPEDAETLLSAARLAFQAGNSESSLEWLEKLLTLSPSDIEALRLKADAAMSLGDRELSLKCMRKIIEIKPDEPDALFELGNALLYYGEISEGVRLLEKALALQPDNLDIVSKIVEGYGLQGDDERIDALFEKLLHQGIDQKLVLPRWIKILEARNRLDKAKHLLEKLATEYPGEIFEEAQLINGRILRREKKYTKAKSALSKCQPASDRIDAFSVEYLYEKALLLEKLGDYKEAYQLAAEANCKAREFGNVRCDRLAQHNVYKRYQQIFTSDWLRDLPDCTEASKQHKQQPVFILGFPRSGTSLVEQILSSHPEVHAGGEMPWLNNLCQGEAARLLGGKDPWWEALATCDDPCDSIAEMRDYYLKHATLTNSDSRPYITDKMPLNISYLSYIRLLFPDARIILMQRHPLDVCLSVYFTNFSIGNAYANDLMDIAWRLKDVYEWAEHCRSTLNMDLYSCRYEQLVAQPEAEVAAMLDYLHLPWHDSCLSFHKSARVVSTASYAQVNQPLYSSSIGRYRHYLAQLTEVVDTLQGMLKEQHYEV